MQARDETRRAFEAMAERERAFDDALMAEALVGLDELAVASGGEPGLD